MEQATFDTGPVWATDRVWSVATSPRVHTAECGPDPKEFGEEDLVISMRPATPDPAYDSDEFEEDSSGYAFAYDDLLSAIHAELESASQDVAFAAVNTALTKSPTTDHVQDTHPPRSVGGPAFSPPIRRRGMRPRTAQRAPGHSQAAAAARSAL